QKMVESLLAILSEGDTIIDGGNSHYTDTVRTAAMVSSKKLNFVDVGTSGGIWGLSEGYSLMVGGEKRVVERLRPILESLAAGKGRWTVKEAIDRDVPTTVINISLLMRFVSRQDERYADKVIAALRQQFGGHEVKETRRGTRRRGRGRATEEAESSAEEEEGE